MIQLWILDLGYGISDVYGFQRVTRNAQPGTDT